MVDVRPMSESLSIEQLVAHPVEHEGERVVTLVQVDEVHGRPAGTAYRNFRENRERFVEGRHYFTARSGDLATKSVGNPDIEQILLTERGYLLLVKSFRDDLAWDVQERLVDGYFRARGIQSWTPAAFAELAATAATQAAQVTVRMLKEWFSEQETKREERRHEQAFIPPWLAKNTRKSLTDLAKLRSVQLGRKASSERLFLELDLRARLNYPKITGNSWDNFPFHRQSDLNSGLETLRREICRSQPPQSDLPFAAVRPAPEA
jgi:ORF6N domain